MKSFLRRKKAFFDNDRLWKRFLFNTHCPDCNENRPDGILTGFRIAGSRDWTTLKIGEWSTIIPLSFRENRELHKFLIIDDTCTSENVGYIRDQIFVDYLSNNTMYGKIFHLCEFLR